MNNLLPIFFPVFPEWKNATVSETPIKFNDLYGQPFIYLYEIKTPENLAGYCVISAYDDLPYLNEASAANNPIANFTQCKNLFFHYLKMNEQPSLLKYEFISTGLGLFYIKLTLKDVSLFYNLKNCTLIQEEKLKKQQKITDLFRQKKQNYFNRNGKKS